MKSKFKKFNILVVFLLIVSMVSFSACAPKEPTGGTEVKEPSKKALEDQEEFDRIANDLFEYYVTADSLTMNVFLVSPGAFDIEVPDLTLGDYSADAFRESIDFEQKQLKLLKTIDRENLKDSQKLTYDILAEQLSWSSEDEEYLYYGESLSPTIGIQSQLPVIFSEYHIYDKEDFDDYLELLSLVPDYFDQILQFEEEKKASGLFMANSAAVNTIAQIREFTKNPESNLLLSTFDEEVNAFEGLTDEEKADFIARNKTIVLEEVLPAYENLATQLEEFNKDNTRTGGLPDLKEGKAYFELLVKQGTGSSRTVEEIDALLDETMKESMGKIITIMGKDQTILEKVMSPVFPVTTPEAILNYLEEAIEEDYPPRADNGYVLKTVDPSLESHMSPAFFLVPPIDEGVNNTIYINQSKVTDAAVLFSTLAHEGYPGHLYQIVYFKSLDEPPVRQLIGTGGYTEGWATYVEQRSYYLAGLEKNVAELLSHNARYTYCLYGKADIGVNYHGWTQKELTEYLATIGITDETIVKEMYESLVAEPGNYIKYTLGSVEFVELREKAEDVLGKDFNEKEFHTFLLETGPAPFDIVNAELDDWLDVPKTSKSKKAA